MAILILWIFFAVIVGLFGSSRKVGFFGGFLLSIFLSPVIALIIVLFSKNKQTDEFERKLLKNQQQQNELLNQQRKDSIVDELVKINALQKRGEITGEESEKLKNKLFEN